MQSHLTQILHQLPRPDRVAVWPNSRLQEVIQRMQHREEALAQQPSDGDDTTTPSISQNCSRINSGRLHICFHRTVRQVAAVHFFIIQHGEARCVVHKKENRIESKQLRPDRRREPSIPMSANSSSRIGSQSCMENS